MKEKVAALAYEQTGAPKVIAKGSGEIAKKLIEYGMIYGIPIQKDEVLVETLMNIDIGEEIPHQLYQVVAELLAYIYRLDKMAQNGSEYYSRRNNLNK